MESTIIPDNDQSCCCCLVSGKFISLSTARVTLRKHKWSHHSNILSCWQVSNFSRYKNLGIHHDRQYLRCNQFREIYTTECTLSKSNKDENYALIWCHGALCVWFDVINLRSHWKRCFLRRYCNLPWLFVYFQVFLLDTVMLNYNRQIDVYEYDLVFKV